MIQFLKAVSCDGTMYADGDVVPASVIPPGMLESIIRTGLAKLVDPAESSVGNVDADPKGKK